MNLLNPIRINQDIIKKVVMERKKKQMKKKCTYSVNTLRNINLSSI